MKNLGASIRARLLNQAKAEGRPFAELLQYYGMERFLYRLSQSKHRSQFVLKGALLLVQLLPARGRPTRDMDLLGRTDHDPVKVTQVVKEICQTVVAEDGLVFPPDTVETEAITHQVDYAGIRARFLGLLDGARIPMQLDIGIGDVVYPDPILREYPSMLDMPSGQLLTYPLETVVAEKTEALLCLGMVNSRLKDYYDLWRISETCRFDSKMLTEALLRTCRHRRTTLQSEPTGLSVEYAKEKRQSWQTFLKRIDHEVDPGSGADELMIIIEKLRAFLLPLITQALAQPRFNDDPDQPVDQPREDQTAAESNKWHWPPGGPWRSGPS